MILYYNYVHVIPLYVHFGCAPCTCTCIYTMAGLMECVVYASIVYMNYSSFWVILHVYIHFSNLTITTVLILLYIIHIYMYVPTA